MPKHLVISHPDVRKVLGIDPSTGRIKGICYPDNSGPDCKSDISKLPPVYRLSSSGALPVLIVEPATLYEIVDVIPKLSTPTDEYKKQPSKVALALEPIIQATSYSLSQDLLRDGLIKTVETCTRDPHFFGEAAQADCTSIVSRLEKERDSLELQQKMDKEQLYAQMHFYSEVERLRKSQISVPRPSGMIGETGPMTSPSELR